MEVERGGRHGPEGMAAGGVWEGDEGKCEARGGDDEGQYMESHWLEGGGQPKMSGRALRRE